MFKTRYTRYLESEVERLRIERDLAIAERQAAINSLLAHVGAPPMQIGTPERTATPQVRHRNVPSVIRRMQESLSRIASANKEAQA